MPDKKPKHKCDKNGKVVTSPKLHKNGSIVGVNVIKFCSVCGLPTESR